MENIPIEFIKIIPSLLWLVVIVTFLIVFYRPIEDLLKKMGGFEAWGLKFTIVKDSIDAAVIELAQKCPEWKVEISPAEKRRALNRAKQHIALFKEADLLWVDDHPEKILNERRMFRQLSAEVDVARSTEEAIAMLGGGNYDLVISDMARGDNDRAGLDLLQQLRQQQKTIPVIFYVGAILSERCVPLGAFGITNRPDELLHLILDVLERIKELK